jgi:hypothetical protein
MTIDEKSMKKLLIQLYFLKAFGILMSLQRMMDKKLVDLP